MSESAIIEQSIPDALLASCSEFLTARLGLGFPRERWRDLARALDAAAPAFGCADAAACARRLLSAPLTAREVEILASHLTVGETYFFREPALFAALQEHILPRLIHARRTGERRLRIWSAGCASGEEPYSIAIALSRLLPDIADWAITILASDINPVLLRRAAQGVYGDWSFRDIAPNLNAAYFTRRDDGRFIIAPRIRSLVQCTPLNLADDVYPAVETNTNAMDIIFCRNVLMYFQPERARAVLEKLSRALVEGGCLIVSPVETSQVNVPALTSERFGDVIVFRKDSDAAAHEPRALADWSGKLPAVLSPPTAVMEQAFVSPPPFEAMPPDKSAAPIAMTHQDAASHYAQGRYAEAAALARTQLAQDTGDGAMRALLARCCANQGQLDEALACCDAAITADKLDPMWTWLRASILQEQGHVDAAIAALQRTLYLDPHHALAHFALGNLFTRQGRHTQARRHLRNALAILNGYRAEQVLPETAGITAGRLSEVVRTLLSNEEAA